jgi:hypothetical protein
MMPALALSVVLSATAVPPGTPVVNHAQPGHYAQPTVQVFERKPVDDYRKANYVQYVAELDQLWQAYRNAGSTPAAWQTYQAGVSAARYRYLYSDPYYLPVVRQSEPFVPAWEQAAGGAGPTAAGAAGATCGKP